VSVAANLNEPVLLERDEELARIERAPEAAREGAGALVLVEGPAGIGKTRLVVSGHAVCT
jgi:predicted ATPase